MSKLEVNTVAPQCGTTLTLGENDDTVVLGTGAAFGGGVGAVKWETTPQTGSFGAVAGRGYFMNTTSGPLTLTLPASPSAGDIVAVSDYARTFNSNNLTINPNGSEKIGGIAEDAILTVDGQSATFVYVDGTEGWINVQETSNSIQGAIAYICASVSGACNTIVTDGDYKVAVFTGPGTFSVNAISTISTPRNNMDWMVVGGGGAGGESWRAGGGGAGGFRESPGASTGCYTTSPLAGNSHVVATATNFPIVVGAGGTGGTSPSNVSTPGSISSFSIYTSAGGGAGGSYNPGTPPQTIGANGGSGGGGGGDSAGPSAGGSGNTPSTTPAQGTNGGNGTVGQAAGGGGGGATDAGSNASGSNPPGTGDGFGGDGAGTDITPSPSYGTPGPSGSLRYYSGGGGGGHYVSSQPTGVPGGYGGGGRGGFDDGVSTPAYQDAVSGTVNTGGGGGGKAGTACSPGTGNGGSGIVMIRYKFQ